MQARPAALHSRLPWHFSLLLLTAFAGFFPSYFARMDPGLAGPPSV